MTGLEDTIAIPRTDTDEITAVSLTCDGVDCDAQTPFYESSAIAREEAKKVGWSTKKCQKMSGVANYDYCPNCGEKNV